MKREPLQAAWAIALGDLRRRHPELADLKSYRQAFRNAAAQVVARAHVRGLAALPSSARSNEARVLAVRMAKAALAFHPQWRLPGHKVRRPGRFNHSGLGSYAGGRCLGDLPQGVRLSVPGGLSAQAGNYATRYLAMRRCSMRSSESQSARRRLIGIVTSTVFTAHLPHR
jgi:hypothetical protein